jgi:hypothetical protein
MWKRVTTFVSENKIISAILALFVLLFSGLLVYTNVVPEKDLTSQAKSAEYQKTVKETTKSVEKDTGLEIPTKEEINDFLATEVTKNGEFTSDEDKYAVIKDEYGELVYNLVMSDLIPEAGMNASQQAFLISNIKLANDQLKTDTGEQDYNKYVSTKPLYTISSTLDSALTLTSYLYGFSNGSEDELTVDLGFPYVDTNLLYAMDSAKFIDLDNGIKVGYFLTTELPTATEGTNITAVNFFIEPTEDLNYAEIKSLLKGFKLGINGSYEALDFESGKFALKVSSDEYTTKQSVVSRSLIPATILLDSGLLTQDQNTLMIKDESINLMQVDANYRVEITDK